MIASACSEEGAGQPAPSLEPTRVAVPGRGGPHGPGVTETEIRMGMTNDLAGTADTPYNVITSAVHSYFRNVNTEDGGVCERNVTITAEDDRYTPEGALEKTRKLVGEHKVLAMMGGLGTAVHTPAAAYLNDPNSDGNPEDGVPDLFLSTGWSGWGDTARYPWTVGFIPDYVSDARVLARYLNDNFGGKKAAILHTADEFGNDYLRGFKETLADPALLVSEQAYDSAAPDAAANPADALRAKILAIRDAGAEAVLLALTPELSAQAYLIADAEGYAPKWLLSYVNSPSTLAREIGGGTLAEQLLKGFEELRGSVSTAYLLTVIDDAESPEMLEHKRIMETYGGPVVTTLSVYGQSLAEAVVATLERSCDEITRESVLRAAESLREFRPTLMLDGISINLGAQDHFAIQTLQLVEIQADGTLKDLGEPVSVE